MAPNKLTSSLKSKPSASIDTPENKATGKAANTTPLINRNWRRVPASTSAAAEHGSPSARHVVDEEDTEGDDGNSDDSKQLGLSYP